MLPSRCLVPMFLLAFGAGCAAAPPQAHSLASKPASSAKAAPASSVVAKAVEQRAVAESEASADAPEPSQKIALDLPRQCAAGPARCVPPAKFVRALCQRTAPEVALAMFKKGTPWTRAYMRLDRELWFAGKKLSSPVLAPRGEELLILREHGGSGVVVGGGSYDALRWNGTCVSVVADEVTLQSPSAVEVATIKWKYLPDATQDSLLENTVIMSSYRARMKKCRASGGDACDRAERDLSQHIAAHVRDGGPVAEPSLLDW